MAQYDDPLSAAADPRFSRYIDPAQAAASGLQWTGGNTGWQPYVSPEQATAQGLQYDGGATPDPSVQRYGYIIPEGGGPVTLGTPENIARSGASMATGPAADALGAAFSQGNRSGQFLAAIAPIQQRQQELATQLQYANKRQAPGLISQIRSLDQQRHAIQFAAAQDQNQLHFEAAQRRSIAHDQAEMAAHQIKLDRETSIDEQAGALMTGLGKLDALHRNGAISSEQYDAGLLDLGQQNQLGLHHPVAGKMFEHFITESDKRNQFNLRRLTSETVKLAGRYGIEPQVDPDTGLPSLELTKSAALQTDKGKGEALKQMNSEMLQKYGVPTGVGSLFNPVEPHTDADGGKSINLPFLDKKGEIGRMKVPKPLFDQMKSDFNDRYFSITPQIPTQSQATAQPAGLQPGATRNVGGTNYSWNGTRWEPQ